MKVRIEPDGTVELELDNPQQMEPALRLVNQLRGAEAEPAEGDLNGLTSEQYNLWSWLVENDSPNGIHLAAIARHVGCSNGAATQRAITLMRAGVLERLRRGVYRARV